MNLILTLLRDTNSREMGTFGTLSMFRVDHEDRARQRVKIFECETCERPWANNTPYISCIPQGTFQLQSRQFYRGGYETLEVMGVRDRSHILIHRGNVPSDVQGCIAIGTERGVVFDKWAVLQSEIAFGKFWEQVKGYVWRNMKIEIAHVCPSPPMFMVDSNMSEADLDRLGLAKAKPGALVEMDKP